MNSKSPHFVNSHLLQVLLEYRICCMHINSGFRNIRSHFCSRKTWNVITSIEAYIYQRIIVCVLDTLWVRTLSERESEEESGLGVCMVCIYYSKMRGAQAYVPLIRTKKIPDIFFYSYVLCQIAFMLCLCRFSFGFWLYLWNVFG